MIIVGSTQTGVDRAALYAAEFHELEIVGFVPRGHLTEEGPRPDLTKRFGLVECSKGRTHAERYRERTRANVALVAAAERGAVLIIGQRSSGSNLTRALAIEADVPWLWLDYIRGRWPWSKQPRGKLEVFHRAGFAVTTTRSEILSATKDADKTRAVLVETAPGHKFALGWIRIGFEVRC